MLEATKRITRPEVPNVPRLARLATGADVWAEMATNGADVPEAVAAHENALSHNWANVHAVMRWRRVLLDHLH